MIRKRVRLGYIVGVFLLFSNPASGWSDETIRIGYRNTSTTDLFLVSILRTHALYDRAGITVELVEFSSPQEIGLSLVTGRIVASLFVSFEHALLIATAEGPGSEGKWRVLAAVVEKGDAPHYFLVVSERVRIRELADLSGRKIGYAPPTPTMRFHLEEISRHYGIRGAAFLPLPTIGAIASLGARQVDAFFSPEPIASTALLDQRGYLLNPRRGLLAEMHGEPYPILLSLARADLGGEVIAKLRLAMSAAIQVIRDNPEVSRKSLAGALRGERGATIASAIRIPSYQKTSEVEPTRYGAVQDAIVRAGFLKTPVRLHELFR